MNAPSTCATIGMNSDVMLSAAPADVQTAGSRVRNQLLQERGLRPGAYTLFFVVGEGTLSELPETKESVESASGSVLDVSGRVFSFWMEWDAEHRRPILSEWGSKAGGIVGHRLGTYCGSTCHAGSSYLFSSTTGQIHGATCGKER